MYSWRTVRMFNTINIHDIKSRNDFGKTIPKDGTIFTEIVTEFFIKHGFSVKEIDGEIYAQKTFILCKKCSNSVIVEFRESGDYGFYDHRGNDITWMKQFIPKVSSIEDIKKLIKIVKGM